MRAVTVSVSYGDVLALTLPRNIEHFEQIIVVTSPDDRETQAVVQSVPRATFITTDLFFRDGATFNKGRAINYALELVVGMPRFGGWLAVVDADTMLPPHGIRWGELRPGSIYGGRRRMLRDLTAYRPNLDWSTVPINQERELPGFLHVWHIDDPAVAGLPLYPVHWKHAGGVDSEHAMRWPLERRIKLPGCECLHLGEDGKNWCGRATVRVDGTVPAEAAERTAALQGYLSRRAGRTWRDFDHEKIASGE